MTLEVKVSKKLVPYELAYSKLRKRVDSIKKHQSKDLLWILEHPLTYTGGIRSNEKEILDKKITLIKTNRGGKITLHNPGQKIVYLALDLNKRKKDIRNLVKNIENSIIEFLKIYKIDSYADKKNIGIWVNEKKIAAIGIRVTQWIAYHGCSININNCLKPYEKIIPCGLNNKKVTSVEKETKINIKDVEKNIRKIFAKNLKNI
jgi:lipoyl(octanoyl) transferase